MSISVLFHVKAPESEIEQFATVFFQTLNVSTYRAHESLNFGGFYYRFDLFGIECLLYRNWDLDSDEPLDEDFNDFNYCIEFSHDWSPALISKDALEDALHLWFCQHIAFMLDVETGYKIERRSENTVEIRTFRKNPDYVPYTDLPSILTNVRFVAWE